MVRFNDMATNLSSSNVLRRPFDFIQSGSAGRQLNHLFQLIRSDPVVNEWAKHKSIDQLSVKTDLKIRVTSTRRIRIRRYYWSLQHSIPGTTDFEARTLILEPNNEPQWLDFPNDPVLTAAPEVLSDCDHQQVLQYVPLRRLTVMQQHADEKPTIVKLKRSGRATDASHRLSQINEIDSPSQFGFSIPTDLGQTHHEHTYQQTYCPGVSLGELLQHSPKLISFKQLGRKLGSFHALVVDTLPTDEHDDFSVLTDKVRQMSALWPTEYERILDCHDWLHRHINPTTKLAPCHGDLSLDNILVDGDHWSLIDFDLAHCGDPIRDIAKLLVQLQANSPILKKELLTMQEDILSGYQLERPEAVSSHELHWHSCRAELEYLYISLRKDIGDTQSRASSLVRAERHCRGIN